MFYYYKISLKFLTRVFIKAIFLNVQNFELLMWSIRDPGVELYVLKTWMLIKYLKMMKFKSEIPFQVFSMQVT